MPLSANLKVRLISAAVMVVVIYGALVLSEYTRWAMMAAILTLGAWEYARMVSSKFNGSAGAAVPPGAEASAPKKGPGVAWLAGLVTFVFAIPHFPGLLDNSIALSASPDIWLWGVSIAAVLLFTLIGFRFVDISEMAPWIYLQLFGCAYFGIYAAGIFGLLTDYSGWRGIFPLLMVQIAIATADSGAYFTGRRFGKNKLAPSISSGKTIEGALGGAALTVLVVSLLGPKLLHTGFLANLGLGLILCLTAIVGDLFISILKRYTGTKDSSNLIPGHGGVLDRFDALFFSAPVAVFYLQLVQ
ncbi:MAG: phosphatidate cytidylyltransferase [Fibrobacteres bacterium]|nr:phosphatidate cytidylyltransferase [Fibrobacterota bacterium]